MDEALVQWQKNSANPLVNGRPNGLSDDFRDPYFFTFGGSKYIIVGTGKSGVGACTLHRQRVVMALEGNCITSEETLMKQFPVKVSDELRMSAERFDLGIMQRGARRELQLVVLHRDEDNRQERIPVVFAPDANAKTGLQHIRYPITTSVKGKEVTLHVTLDVIIK